MLTSYLASQHLPTGVSTPTHQGGHSQAFTVLAPPPGGYRLLLILLHSHQSNSVSCSLTLTTLIHSLIRRPLRSLEKGSIIVSIILTIIHLKHNCSQPDQGAIPSSVPGVSSAKSYSNKPLPFIKVAETPC